MAQFDDEDDILEKNKSQDDTTSEENSITNDSLPIESNQFSPGILGASTNLTGPSNLLSSYQSLKSSKNDNDSPSRKAFDPSELLNLFQSIKPAQEKERQDLSNIGIQAGANQIAQGIARGYGADIGSGEAGIKTLQEQAKLPVANIKQQIDTAKETMGAAKVARDYQETEKMADPDSGVSKLFVSRAIDSMLKQNPNLKREDLENQFVGKISALQLEKMMTKGGILGQNNHFTQVKGQTYKGHPINQDYLSGKVYDALTGKALTEADSKDIVNLTPKLNPITGELEYPNPENLGKAKPTPGMPNPVTGEQPLDATAQKIAIDNFKPNVAQRKALEKEGTQFDKGIKDHAQRLRDADALIEELNSNNKLQIPAVTERMAKIAKGGGVLNAQEEQRFQGSQAILDRAMQWLQTHKDSTLTPENKKQFAELLATYTKTAQEAVGDARTKFNRRMEMNYQIPTGFSDKYFGNDISTPNIDKAQATKKAAPAGMVTIKGPNGQVAQMTKENAKKYLSKPGYELVK